MASFDEYKAKLDSKYKKKKEEEKSESPSKSTVTTNNKVTSPEDDSFEAKRNKLQSKYLSSSVDAEGANNWFAEARAVLYNLGNNKSDASSYTTNFGGSDIDAARKLLETSNDVWKYMYSQKDNLDNYKELDSAYGDITHALRIATSNADEVNKYYSRWETEEDYKYYNDVGRYGEKATYDIEAGKAEVEGLLNGDEITALRKRQIEIQEEMRKLGNQSKGKGATKRQKLQSELNEVTAKIKEIESQATQKKAYLNQAEYIQGGIKLSTDAKNAEDFAENSKYVSTKADGFWDKLTADTQGFKDSAYEYINNVGGYRDEYKRKHSIYSSDTSVDGTSSFEEKGYDYMNDEEIAIYNYYYATEGKDKAEEFLKSIQESLSYRKGSADFGNLEGRTFAELLFGVEAGLDQFSSGMKNLFNTSDDYIPSSATQMTSGMVREDLADNGAKILGSSLGQIGYDLTTTTSNMLPSILTSAVVSYLNPALGSAVGAGLMGASAGGNAYAEMLNLGYDKGQARGYSLLVGASEAGLQYVLGGISSLGGVASKNLTTKIATSLASKVDNAIAKVAINTGTKLVGNMVSEFGEEYLQEVLTPLFKNIAFNTNEDVELFTTEALYSGILGALSAGLLEGGSTLRSEVGTYKAGKSIIEKGQVGNLADLGKTYSTDTEAFKIASQVNDSTDAYTLGQLLQEVGADSLTESNVAEIEKSLLRKGVAPENAKSIAKWIYKASQGEVLTKSQQSAIFDNPDIVATLKEVSTNSKHTVNQRIQGYQDIVNSLAEETTSPEAKSTVDNIFEEETPQAGFAPYSEEYIANIAKEYEAIGISPENARVMAVAQLSNANANTSSPKTENIVDAKYDVSDDGKTTNLKTGNAVEIKNIADISSSGEANLTLDDGAVVKASDISFSSPVQAVFVENIGKMKVGKKPLGTNSANVLYQAAMTAWKKNPKMTADEAMSLVKGLEESYIYGAYNLGRERLTSRNEDGTAVLFAGELSQDQRKIAYELGVKDGVSKADADQKVIDELKEKSKGKTAKKSFGKIIFEDGINVDESTLTDTQKANLNGIKLLADLTSVEFHVFRSDRVGNTFKYSLPNGKKTSANGWFVAGTNQIWIDLNAGNVGEGTMLRTAAHEISHYIKAWSPTKWKAMADLLMQTFADNNVNTERMLNRQKDKIKRRYTKKDMPSESKLLDMAYEELVSDALTDMLTDGSIVNFIAEVKAKDKNLAQRILDAIKNLLKNWGLIIDDYKGRDLDTPEAQALSQFEDTFKKLQEMYRDALMDANETVATIGARNLADFAEAKNTEGESLFQYRAMEADESTYKDMLRKWGKMTDAQIDNLFTTIDKAMDIIKDNLEVLDYAWEADIDDRAFSPVKRNSDSLYQVSLDFSTLCRKRLLQQTIQAHLQEALNRPLTREDGIAIRDALMAIQEEGRQIEIACALCYVESARMKSHKQIKKFINNRETVLKDFFATKNGGDIKAKIEQAEAEARKRLGAGDTPLTRLPSNIKKEIRAAKKEAKASYVPTAEEARLIEIAKGMTVNDFATPSGLENLAKNYPDLFDAYARYIVNATHSKGIENDTWWRAGDSSKISDVLIANMNKENGLRSQSWSDFQVIHILDYIAATIELSTRNAKEQVYSKVPDYVELMGQTGVMINMSLIPTRQFNGSLEYDSVEGMAYERALELREKYPATAGTICIGIDNQQIQMLLADSNIDYVIPYHKSSMAASVRKLMHIPTWSQYEEYQSEKNLSRKDAEAQANKYGVKLLAESDPNYHKHTAFSEWFDLEVAKQIAKMENANPSNKAMQKKYGVMYGGYMAMQDAANNYLKLCAERGIAPKFSHEKANFTSEENYWKLLIDRKMVNNATGEIIEQQTIKPVFDEGEVLRILNDELERYPSVKADQEYAVRKVTEKFLSGEVKSGMSAEAIAKVMKTPMDNIAKTNILASAEETTVPSDRMFSQDYIDNLLNGFGITKPGDYLHVKRCVLDTLVKENFFTDSEHRSRTETNEESGMIVEINKSGIDETFNFYNYACVGRWNKFVKLATIRRIPEIIKFGHLVKDNAPNMHKGVENNKTFAYIEHTIVEEGKTITLRLDIKKSPQKNKFWVHKVIEIENVSSFPASTESGTEAGQTTADTGDIVTQMSDSVNMYSDRDLAPTFYSQMGKVVEGVKQEKLAANSVVNLLRGKGVKAEEIRWSGIVPFLEGKKSVTKQELLDFINGSMLQIGEQMSETDLVEIVKKGNNYIIRNKEDGTILDTFYKVGRNSWENDSADYVESFQEIKDFATREYGRTRWSQYKLNGGENYREIVFTMPNSSYSNQMMRVHWGDEAEGVLVHARIQDFDVNGKKMLFIEEIQSDYHNEGHKDGYQNDAKLKELQELEEKANEAFYALEDYSTELTGLAGEYEKVAKTQKGRELLREKIRTEKALKQAQVEYDSKVPDAPFKDNYHEYVLKRLLRMAAEQGYDSIGWTTADIQSKRWSDEYAEGYRIEYDQDIPKFLKKYGRQWGAKVGKSFAPNSSGTNEFIVKRISTLEGYIKEYENRLKTLNENGSEAKYLREQILEHKKTIESFKEKAKGINEIWSMEITDSMKNSVLYEGQVMYSDRDSEGNTLSKEQQEFFKDSKVRDEYGNLLVCYHGTDAEFSTFDADYISQDNKLGFGFYFLAGKKLQYSYKHPLKTYLNITNPITDTSRKFSREALTEFCNKLGIELDYDSADYDLDVYERLSYSYTGKTKDFLMVAIDTLGVDGVISENRSVAVAFLPEQIKETTNKTPTTDPDIRFSERDPEASNRAILANSLESAAKNDTERNKLAEYKKKISLIESEEQRLSEIQKQLFTKGAVEPSQRKALQFEAKQITNRINTYDRQLLNLESTTALKNVLNREKELARKKQKQKDNEYLKQYKEKVAKTTRELMDKHQESRKKAIESRSRTAMRHKIQRVVSELNQLLLKGSKERNVKLGLQPAVAAALEAINMDTVSADERVAKYNALIAKATDPDVIESLTATRDRIQSQGDVMASKLEDLRKAYAKIKANKEDAPEYYIAEASLIEQRIESVIEKVGNTPLRDMSLSQLEAVHDLYSMVLTTVRNANKVFVQGKLEDLQNNASATMEEISAIRTLPEERMDLGWTRSFSWNEMIPVYAFRRIGSQTLEKFFWEAIRGQNIIATDLKEADDFAKETRKKYGHGKWDMDKVHEFELKDGRTFRVTLRHMMSIYAYSKRPQALDHMTKGGFFFNDKSTFRKKGGVLNLIKSNEVGYCVDKDVLDAITDTMEKAAKGSTKYVDEMQTYLTKMGDKGNEVSRVLWGIDIFKERVYFPLKSVKDFIFQANQTAQESSLKNDGMTKETKPGASNPIVLESFDDVWANHVNRMSQYHGLVIPIENLNKIHNYGTWANTDSMSVSTMLRARFGEAVNDYLNNFIKDLNGASSTSGASNPFFSFVGKFKKTAVAASSSVVVQQPTAVLRAMAVMDGKYFVGMPKVKRLSTKWNELQKYAPIAIIKEIGGFDAGAGRQATEWLNSDTRRGIEKIGGKIDDITMMGAAVGDQIGWCTIWEAVKREIKATTNLKEGSEEFLQKAGERFTEVIVLTQVYDSTLSRSGFMRSKHDSVKMLTAFMGEPTVSINMMFDATVQAKRKTITKRKAARILGATYASILAASIAASLIYALRDDDEDESYLEKLAEAFGGKVLGDINPLNMLPGFRDIISIFDGWDVERTDMAVFKDIKDAFDGLTSENKSTQRKIEDFAGAIASVFGLPLKNLLRTGRELYNGIKNIFDDITPSGVGDAFKRGVTGEKKNKNNALYDAIVSGDTAKLEIYRQDYKDDKSYETAVRKALRENDPRIKEAAEARNSGDIAEYTRIVKEIKAEGFFSQDTIVASVNAEINAINKGESTSATEDKESSIYKMEDYYDSIVGGDQASAYVVKEDLINIDVANGKDRDEAEKDFNSKFASYIREQYEDGNVSEYEAKNLLTQYGEQSSEEATSKVQYWAFKENYPDYDDLSEEAIAKYYSDVEPYGISIGVYYDYSKQKAKCKGVDSDGDGKTDSGSKKKEILNVINSLPLTYAQKDVLYYLNGWSAKTINEAPWH